MGDILFAHQLHQVDGLTLNSVKQLLRAKQDLNLVTLTGSSGIIWGTVRHPETCNFCQDNIL